MGMRKITLNTKGLSSKQYSTLVLELNLMAKSWSKFGADIEIKAPGSERIISWGTKRHDETVRPETSN